jgi:hypothetical protein
MKIGVIAVALLAVAGCKKSGEHGHDHDHPSGEGPAAMGAVDLSPGGVAATMAAPKGAAVSQATGAARVEAEGFGLEVSKGAADLGAVKSAWREDDVNPLVRLVRDEPTVVIAETELLGRLEYHFTSVVAGFTCQDQRERQWSLAEIERMVDACETLAVK